MIKQVSSFLMLCLFAQISFGQTSEKQNLKLDTTNGLALPVTTGNKCMGRCQMICVCLKLTRINITMTLATSALYPGRTWQS